MRESASRFAAAPALSSTMVHTSPRTSRVRFVSACASDAAPAPSRDAATYSGSSFITRAGCWDPSSWTNSTLASCMIAASTSNSPSSCSPCTPMVSSAPRSRAYRSASLASTAGGARPSAQSRRCSVAYSRRQRRRSASLAPAIMR